MFAVGKTYLARDSCFRLIGYQKYKVMKINEEKQKITLKVIPLDKTEKTRQMTVPFKAWNCTPLERAEDETDHVTVCSEYEVY